MARIKDASVEEVKAAADIVAVVSARTQLRKLLLDTAPKPPRPAARLGKIETADGFVTTPALLEPEPGVPLPVLLKGKRPVDARQPLCLLLDLAGKAEAGAHPLAKALLAAGWLVAAPDLRATGETRPASGKSWIKSLRMVVETVLLVISI